MCAGKVHVTTRLRSSRHLCISSSPHSLNVFRCGSRILHCMEEEFCVQTVSVLKIHFHVQILAAHPLCVSVHGWIHPCTHASCKVNRAFSFSSNRHSQQIWHVRSGSFSISCCCGVTGSFPPLCYKGRSCRLVQMHHLLCI